MSTTGKSAPHKDEDKAVPAFTEDDLAKIFHYPSIGQLFNDSTSASLDDFRLRMTTTRDQLEKIIRHGNREEADKAVTVIGGIDVTLDFLLSLQELRAAGS